ncbi:PREDICTED: lisH domain and HEAT repeat-containing protein KIAA1468 homolog isoform X2 [Priapulus caudatus]|uniref:LisH domain and HEAT repeat-containing protein KIAA1468 homolog isoform X2 n=1 Tax=Priapulus caudatus TaxID=37621 RepID=A0ABM1ET65_PRICU|nr:PREDICTED: lisH domain and HEAT repeat-containing protein KIAA1468 homolog isoform X2 [Priapulus caudatus]
MAEFSAADEDFIENQLEGDSLRIIEPVQDDEVALDSIAAKLLREKLWLTALELHTELLESGRELPRLRDYFSNPGNFEQQTVTKYELTPGASIQRTASAQTLDSLDFGRYSDDGEKQTDERLAVLEFELRKAKETIQSLKASLTKAAESDLCVSPDLQVSSGDPIKPHEQRALNYLVNEYLMNNGYRLTSITFADENENQDFEDWGDVGLNVPSPPDLVQLYRDYGQHLKPVQSDSSDFSCMVHLEEDAMEKERDGFTQLKEQLEGEISDLKEQLIMVTKGHELLAKSMADAATEWREEGLLTESPSTALVQSPASDFVSNAGLYNLPNVPVIQDVEGDSEIEVTVEATDDQPIDIRSTERDFAGQADGEEDHAYSIDILKANRNISESFQEALEHLAQPQKPLSDNRITTEVQKVAASGDEVVLMLARCLPYVIPNILLNKREELLPLILCTASLHPVSDERDKLLNLLFNLIKKPDEDQRHTILTGCVTYAHIVGPTRAETELLPQCWEQINHKLPERRLLVAEACGALTPYLPTVIRSSLVLSMLQQMLEDDKTDAVREAVTHSLGLLMAYIDDEDKHQQCQDLLLKLLLDGSDKVYRAALQTFLPSLAAWSLELNKLQSCTISRVYDKLEELTSGPYPTSLDETRLCLLLECLKRLVPILFMSVLQSGPYCDSLPSDPPELEVGRFPKGDSPLQDLSVMLGSDTLVLSLVAAYDQTLSEEWFQPWAELDWVYRELIPNQLQMLRRLEVNLARTVHSYSQFFYSLCKTFGRAFTRSKIKPQFAGLMKLSDEELDQVSRGETALTSCVVPVYAAGVLGVFPLEEERKELSIFLFDVLVILCMCGAPLDTLRAAFTEMWQVRISTVPAFGTVIETATQREVVEKAHMQFQGFLDDPIYKDAHAMHVEVIHTLSRIGPNTEPRFRDDFILPRLAILAANNNHTMNETKKRDVAMVLFEAYSALSCCFVSEQLIREALLSGMRCLHRDMALIAPDHEEIVGSMIREFEVKLESLQPVDGGANFAVAAAPSAAGTSTSAMPSQLAGGNLGGEVKAAMMSKFKDFKDKSSVLPIANIFKKK